jgi:3-phosphoshikimate 1-carboxyvinyltransferase
MLAGFGAELDVTLDADGARHITLRGEAELRPQEIDERGPLLRRVSRRLRH